MRGIKIFWPAVGFEQDQFAASFWGDFPKGTIKDGQTHQELVNYLTPVEVAAKTIPALNEHVTGRPLHSFAWSASDRQQWWDWGQVAIDANNAYDWANPPVVTLNWSANTGATVTTHIQDTYMDLSCLVQGPPTYYVTSTHGPTFDKTAIDIVPGSLVKVDPFVGISFDWGDLLTTVADDADT